MINEMMINGGIFEIPKAIILVGLTSDVAEKACLHDIVFFTLILGYLTHIFVSITGNLSLPEGICQGLARRDGHY